MVTLMGVSLSACGNEHSYNLHKLRAEHAKLLKQYKKHSTHKHKNKHSAKPHTPAKQNNSNQSNSSKNNKKAISRNISESSKITNHHSTRNDGAHLDSAQQANVNKGLYPDGTRRPDSFANSSDYQRYNAWYQGYNYDPNTNTYTRMNDQQLNDMRQQMNANGGQNFK